MLTDAHQNPRAFSPGNSTYERISASEGSGSNGVMGIILVAMIFSIMGLLALSSAEGVSITGHASLIAGIDDLQRQAQIAF